MNALLRNRTEAGMALAQRLYECAGPDAIVLGIDNGGTLVAFELARCLEVPFDLLLVQALELPCDENIVLGAVAPEGVCVLNDDLVDLLDVEADAIGSLRNQADAALLQRDKLVRGGRRLPVMKGRTAVLVEDVVDNAIRMRAAMLYLHQHEPRVVVVAAPVITQPALRELRLLANHVVALDVPEHAPPMDRVYADAVPAGDDDVRRVLGVNELDAAMSSPASDE